MKRGISLLLLSMAGVVASAQDYDALWKQVKTAQEKDQPQSVLSSLRKIEQKANKEGRYGHFLAAVMSDVMTSREISHDSLLARTQWVEKWEKSLRRPVSESLSQKNVKEAVASVVCRVVLNRCNPNDKEYSTKNVNALLDSLVSNKRYLAALTEKDASLAYIPMVENGADSKYFDHDLLSLLCMEMHRYDILERYYSSVGNREVACLASALNLREKAKDIYGSEKCKEVIAKADSLIQQYQDLSVCGVVAMVKYDAMSRMPECKDNQKIDWIDEALKRWPACPGIEALQDNRMALVNPKLQIRMDSDVSLSNIEQKVYIDDARNLSSVRINVIPLKCSGMYDFGDLDSNKYIAKLKPLMDSGKARSYLVNYSGDQYAEYDTFKDSLTIGTLPVGVYMLEVIPTPAERAGFVRNMSPRRTILRISDQKVMCIALPEKKKRYIVVNAISGHPATNATLHINDGYGKFKDYRCDANGECIVENTERYALCYATTPTDNASVDTYCQSSYYYQQPSAFSERAQVFTDRELYRPGQKVQMSAVFYSVADGKETNVTRNKKVTATLRDSSYKEISKVELVTDDYGCVSATFDIPDNGRNGRYIIQCGNASEEIHVEEYVRPTFEVEIDQPEVEYHVGDTLTLRGRAKAYSGAGIADARVVYEVRRALPWWWRQSGSSNSTLLRDTVTTSADGTFEVRMPMTMPEGDASDVMPLLRKGMMCPHFYNITASATVTSMTGESHSGDIRLPLSNRSTILTADIKEKYLADNGIKMTVSRFNAIGKDIPGKVQTYIDGLPSKIVDANKEFTLPVDIASGSHRFMAVCEQDTLEADIYIFRMNDEKPHFQTHDWFYVDQSRFPEDDRGVSLQVGSSDEDVHVAYVICSGNTVVESGTTRMSDSNINRRFVYKPEYGDGITIAYAWVKAGQTYTHVARVERPLPSIKLNVTWKTFRNKLLPGQKEQWQLVVRDASGAPCKSMITTTMFDKSLDAIRRHDWSMSDPRSLSLPYMNWSVTHFGDLRLWLNASYDGIDYKSLAFSRFNTEYLDSYGDVIYIGAYSGKRPMMLMSKAAVNSLAMEETAPQKVVARVRSSVTEDEAMADVAMDTVAVAEPETEPQKESLRTNFEETAFFMPQLLTDDNGVATLSFTLPESVTTWRVLAMAHDKTMRFGMLEDQVVAQKQLMVQPRMPRFLRIGDKATLSTMVSNLSDKDLVANVRMVLSYAETEQPFATLTQKVTLKAGETQSVTFPVEGFAKRDIICKVLAEGNGFSDGEQHLLPVMSDEEIVTTTSTYTFYDAKDTSVVVGIPTGASDVKVEYTANPAYMMLDALPAIAEPDGDNAISLSSALYANVLASELRDTLPYYNIEKLVGKLLLLQQSDGSFSWWKGMSGSSYMTLSVVKTLCRMESIVGKQKGIQPLLRKAFSYLNAEIAKDVKQMKKDAAKGTSPYISEYHLDYLYSVAKYNKVYGVRDYTSDQKYLVSMLSKAMAKADMQTKSMAAVVFSLFGEAKSAGEYVESIRQHTVYRADVGRYFDSYRARYSWCDYRIPTHTMAIEAMLMVTPSDRKSITDMKRWLLSSKRTQRWDNPYNAVNAVHAFYDGMPTKSVMRQGLDKATLADTTFTKANKNTSFEVTVPASKASQNVVTESWVSAYVSYSQKVSDIADMSTGIKVKRELIAASPLKVGDKVKVRITITADRDYDFVTVTDNRAACLEPVNQISGYRNGCYQEIKDTSMRFYYDKLHKGTHTIEAEYYVERSGKYTSGSVTAVCTYAPEFRGTGKSYTIEAKSLRF